MSLEEFAALVRLEPAQVETWARLGLLDPTGSGRFDDFDLLRLMAINHYEALGYDDERLAAAIKSGEVQPFLGEQIYPRGTQLTLEEAAERVGLDPHELREVLMCIGRLPRGILEEDLPMLEGFKTIAAVGLPAEAMLEGARAFGDNLRRLAEALVRLVHVYNHERLVAEGLSDAEVAPHVHAIQEAAQPLLDEIVEHIFHEHFLQALIEDAYVHLVDTESPSGRGSVETTIVFIDVESFTQLTEREGDQAALDTMRRVDAVVRALAFEHDGKVVKHIGDALMLAFREAGDAVSFAVALHQAARTDPTLPGLRVGMHSGSAVYREGDYIGTTVNLASRVTTTATGGQTVLTEAVAKRLGEGAPVEPAGVRLLRGAEHPVRLYRLTQREEKRDPACGQTVQAPPAARLRQDAEELWFCSEECLREFLLPARTSA